MNNTGKSISCVYAKYDTIFKVEISITSLFMYCCKSSSVFCLTWSPINMILRSVVEYGCPMSEQKWKMHDKESYVNFNTWSISIGLVTWIDWESTIVFIQLHCKPTGKKTICVPPPLHKLPLWHPSTKPYTLSMNLLWVGMDNFWNHIYSYDV